MKRQQAVFSIRTSPRGRTVRRSSTNHIVHVTDSVTSGHSYAGAFHFADGANTDTEYEYDDNGNMTKDLNRGITGITYNALNLPSVIQFGDNSYIEYTYGADGQKLRTQYGVQPGLGPLTPADAGGSILAGGTAVTDAVETVPSTDELSRVDYCGNMVYDRGERRLLLENGYVTFNLQTNAPSYHFYLRDHLGNNRVVMAHNGTVEQVTHYYPFGGVQRESTNPGLQPYKYGGKELDRTSGLDAYDYGARQYNPVTARWDRVDPLSEKYYNVSPYAYCHDNPIMCIDPDGKDDYYTQNGVFIRSDDKKTNYVYVGDSQLMFKGKPITGIDFKNKASTIYAESSIGYGIADYHEMCAIASVHLRNNKAFGQGAELAKSFRKTELDKQTDKMQMANAALINALQGGKDYSNGATQWDGAEQAMVPSEYKDKPSNGKFMFKMNTMGWSMSDKHYSSWKEAIENKFGKGKFTVPQTKEATSNYGGMNNKGRIRLQSTAQYGLTIFWKEVK